MKEKKNNSKEINEKAFGWSDSTHPNIEQVLYDEDSNREKLRPRRSDTNWDSKKITMPIENSTNKQTDWDIESAYYSEHLNSNTHPPSIDLRDSFFNDNGEWSIHQQKEGTFSCIGYATTDMVHWYLNQEGFPVSKLSARFNWMAAKEIDSLTSRPTTFIEQAGSTLKAGLDVCRKYGSVDDILLPTDSNDSFLGTTQQFYSQASKYKIHAYYSLMLPQSNIIASLQLTQHEKQKLQILIWKKWLAENGPLLVRVNVDKTFYNAQTERLENYQEEDSFQKHAALLVGYDEEGFILRNSWGKAWGEKGYATLSNDYAFQALDEVYGIIMPSNEVGNPKPPKPHEKSLLERLFFFL